MLPEQKQRLTTLSERADSFVGTLQRQHEFLVNWVDVDRRPIRSMNVAGQAYTVVSVLAEWLRLCATLRDLSFPPSALVPRALPDKMIARLEEAQPHLTNIDAIISRVRTEKRAVRFIDGPGVTFTDNGDHVGDFGAPISTIANILDAAEVTLASLGAVARITRRSDVYEKQILSTDLKDSADALTETSTNAKSSSEILKQAQAHLAQLVSSKENADKAASEEKTSLEQARTLADQRATDVERLRAETEQRAQQAQQHLDAISATLSRTKEVDTELIGIADRLRSADARLTEVEGKFADSQRRHTDDLAKVEALIKQAESMLKGATVAGLAKSFDDERKDIDKKMWQAFAGFACGIVLLFLLSGILVSYVTGLQSIGFIHFTPPGNDPVIGEVTPAGVLSRALILLAPFWLALFSARRYSHLFDLRQKYSHKYNLAFSLEGFKKQAPKYGDEIAALVFQTIGRDPMDGKSSSLGESPLSTIADLFKSFEDRITSVLKKGGEE